MKISKLKLKIEAICLLFQQLALLLGRFTPVAQLIAIHGRKLAKSCQIRDVSLTICRTATRYFYLAAHVARHLIWYLQLTQ